MAVEVSAGSRGHSALLGEMGMTRGSSQSEQDANGSDEVEEVEAGTSGAMVRTAEGRV